MRKLVTSIVTAGVLSLASFSGANAAPVPGYEEFYNAVFVNCTLPLGTLQTCEAAINAYAAELVVAVEVEEANQSFTELRLEVFEANEPDEEFQADIDALFELLLPGSGALGAAASPA